jgi:hypothetical protein
MPEQLRFLISLQGIVMGMVVQIIENADFENMKKQADPIKK